MWVAHEGPTYVNMHTAAVSSRHCSVKQNCNSFAAQIAAKEHKRRHTKLSPTPQTWPLDGSTVVVSSGRSTSPAASAPGSILKQPTRWSALDVFLYSSVVLCGVRFLVKLTCPKVPKKHCFDAQFSRMRSRPFSILSSLCPLDYVAAKNWSWSGLVGEDLGGVSGAGSGGICDKTHPHPYENLGNCGATSRASVAHSRLPSSRTHVEYRRFCRYICYTHNGELDRD